MHFIIKKPVDYFRARENGFNIHISYGVGF